MALNDSKNKERHCPGVFKQQNKIHKTGRHRSKGSISVVNKGRIHKTTIKKHSREIGKEVRRNQAVQIRKKKREEFLKLVRNENDPPLIIALVSLSNKISYFEILEKLKTSDPEAVITYSENGYSVIRIPRFKQRFMFVTADTNRIYHTLNALKVADVVIFLTSVHSGMDENTDHLVSCIISQGLPSNSIVSITDLQSVPKKKHQEIKEEIQTSLNNLLPNIKVTSLESFNDFMSFFRTISTKKQKVLIEREKRPYMLVESLKHVKNQQNNTFALNVRGYIRGQTLSVNDLVHVIGWKDFKLEKLEVLKDPHRCNNKQNVSCNILKTEYPDIEKQESLQSENFPDLMDAEQTWPTEQELKEADKHHKRLMKRIPEGFSEYQATWIPDCDAEELSDISDLEEISEKNYGGDLTEFSDSDDNQSHVSFASESVMSEMPMEPDKYDKQIDKEEEEKILKKIKEAKSDRMFPDEVDTPIDTSARIRFQKFRGLKSLRTSPWDPKENLPADFARIFQFQNFQRTEKRIRKELKDKNGVLAGTFVSMYLEGVTEQEYENLDRGMPMVIIGVLPHEQKMSVLNIILKRPNILESDEPIKSKDELIIQCGYRRFKCCPIFSQLGNGAVHKYERFFQPDETVVATIYAPVQFPPCSVLAFKEHADSSVELVASGRILSADPDRIVVKRTVLSGHPFKINRKSAVIRFMFYNREDIEWFKPIELRTKYGRRGHIKEPLGTHGHMKCIFDKPIKSQDTVLLNLYKRVFPKWIYNNLYTSLYTTCN